MPRSRSAANAEAATAGATTAAARMTHRPTAPNRKMARLATSKLVLVVDVVEKSAGAALASGARISMPSRKTSSETNKTRSVNAAKVSRPRSQVWNSLMTRAPIRGMGSLRSPEWSVVCGQWSVVGGPEWSVVGGRPRQAHPDP